jgi:hypothetical protein
MTSDLFLAQFRIWILDMRRIAGDQPGTGACTLASAMQLWLWTLNHLQTARDADGAKLYQSARQGVTFPLADALCWLLAARCQILDLIELRIRGRGISRTGRGLRRTRPFPHRFVPCPIRPRRWGSRPHLRRTGLWI